MSKKQQRHSSSKPSQKPHTHKTKGETHFQSGFNGFWGCMAFGWAYDSHQPLSEVPIRIVIDGTHVVEGVADQPSPALAGRVAGQHAFRINLPEEFFKGAKHEIRAYFGENGDELERSPQYSGSGHFDGHFDGIYGCVAQGWACERVLAPTTTDVEIYCDNVLTGTSCANHRRLDLHAFRVPSCQCGFRQPMPAPILDGSEHLVEIRAGGVRLLGGPITFRTQFAGWLDIVTPTYIEGWISDLAHPDQPLQLDVCVDGVLVKTITADIYRSDAADTSGSPRCGFSADLPAEQISNHQTVGLLIAGTQKHVLKTPIFVWKRDQAIGAVQAAVSSLLSIRNTGHSLAPSEITLVRCTVFAPVLEALRQQGPNFQHLTVDIPAFAPAAARLPADIDPVVDAIIPVYRDRAMTIECIESLLRSSNQVPMEIIVIDDCSPDPDLSTDLLEYNDRGLITLIRNPQNLGFVQSVNRGMQLHPDRDIVIVNSDTILPVGFLDRMHAAAYLDRNIATVTPLSNNATICSYPLMNVENSIPSDTTSAELDHLCREFNAGLIFDMPTGIGFCMYIRRNALDEIGGLDEKSFGHGYGEENDWCFKASAVGWRHIAASDIFVEHAGGRSFGPSKTTLIEEHLKILDKRYPDYRESVHKFIMADPIRRARRNLDMVRLRRYASQYVLFVIHGIGGGVAAHCSDLEQLWKRAGMKVLLLESEPGEWARLTVSGIDVMMRYHLPSERSTLNEDLIQLGIWHIHFHHILGFHESILELPAALGSVAYDVTLHDYLTICPRMNCIDESGLYCGNPPVDACERCIQLNGTYPGFGFTEMYERIGSMSAWRGLFKDHLARARKVFVPSMDIKRRITQQLGLTGIDVRTHPERVIHFVPPRLPEGPLHVAVIGGLGPHKGFNILRRCALAAYKDGAAITFTVFGNTCDDQALAKIPNVELVGRYERSALPGILAQRNCRVAAFFSVWPETFCYALSEALSAGLYPVAFDLGAPADRIRELGWGKILPLWCEPKEINRALLEADQERERNIKPLSLGYEYKDILTDYYELSQPQQNACEKG